VVDDGKEEREEITKADTSKADIRITLILYML